MKQIRRILIANRGEIAARIIHACREEGITSILAYSSADKNTLPVEMADESVCIGPPRADRSYLFIPSVIGAAKGLKADAVHPGYGFLAENGDFAEICEEQGLIFIGPSSKSIRLMGDKAAARALMTKSECLLFPVLRDWSTQQKKVWKQPEIWAILYWSKRRPAEAGKGCGRQKHRMNWRRQSMKHQKKHGKPLAQAVSI